MRLPYNEIRDITRLLEEGERLPDKYRIMLFGDQPPYPVILSVKSFAAKSGAIYEIIETTHWFGPDSFTKEQTSQFVRLVDDM